MSGRWLAQFYPTHANSSVPDLLEYEYTKGNPYDTDTFRRYAIVLTVYIMGPLCFIGILCNILSVFVLGRYDVMQRTTRFLLQNLAIADSLFLVSCLTCLTFSTHWGRHIMLPFVVHLPAVWIVVMVTTERYVAICWPYRASKLCTMLHARRAVAAVYVGCVSFVVSLFVTALCLWGHRINLLKKIFDLRSTYFYAVVAIYSALDFFLPMSLLVFFNARLIKAVRESFAVRRQQVRVHCTSRDVQGVNNERKCTIQLIAVVTVFVVCQLPTSVTMVCQAINHYRYSSSSTLLWHATNYCIGLNLLLMVVNSSINFFIYFLTGRQFRNTLLDCIRCRRRTSDEPT